MADCNIGFLPLYLALYQETLPQMGPRIDRFRQTVQTGLEARGLSILSAPVCTRREEIADAVARFEREGVAAIVTLHLSYSPSLECIDALAGTALPLIVLDTTEDFAFGSGADADAILYNHGIHGVQDMCNLLVRRGKAFAVCAGHWQHSDVLDRVAAHCRAALLAARLRTARVGIVGEPFDGMGDFAVPFARLRAELGIEVVPYDFEAGAADIAAVRPEEIEQEHEADRAAFAFDPALSRAVYDRTARVALGLRRWIEREGLSALTVNFLETEGSPAGLPVMPFTECSKAMGRGVGYAGEGDVLTAAFVGALLTQFPDCSFTEMFCPDWEGGAVFLSHMGELNYRVCRGKPFLTEKDFPFTSAENPTVAYGVLRGGAATLVNLAPCGEGRYRLIACRGEMLDVPEAPGLRDSVAGWFRPARELGDFLERFSRCGGTHHSAVLYAGWADCAPLLEAFAGMIGAEFAEI